jgi:hypothetical protein
MLDYAKTVRLKISYAIHDDLLNANGIGLVEMLAAALLGNDAGTYTRLEPGASADI